jgi:flagellar export protein FliJ
MKRFAFRLQRILELRRAREKASLVELGREQQRLALENEKLDLFCNERELQLQETRVGRSKPFTAWAQAVNVRYLNRVGRAIEFQTHAVRRQETSVETARRRFHERRRDTQVLDHLRDKKQDEWRVDVLREEGKILDEVGSRRKGQ